MKKLFLLDNMALVYRAYFAFANNHRVNSKGLNTSAMFGFTNTLLDVLKNEKPTHIAVVTDTAAPTERHIEFEAYKAHREAMPDDLATALPYVKRIVEAMNIPFIGIDGYEADDIIGTLAQQAEALGFDEIFMMTPDKDFGQLVTERIKMYKPARMGNGAEKMGIAEICKRFEIDNCMQVIDILGLMGDAADNIPGIPGVGEKTAMKFIKEYGSMEGLYENTDKLTGKMKEKVVDNKEQAFLSKRLATINVNVPCEFHEESFTYTPPNKEAVQELFEELEFRNLLRRVLGDDAVVTPAKAEFVATSPDLFNPTVAKVETEEEPDLFSVAPSYETAATTTHNYILINTPALLAKLITELNACAEFSIDTETTSINAINAELVGISIAMQAKVAYYIPVSENKQEAMALVAQLKPLLEDTTKLKIGQNIKYDYQVLSKYGVTMCLPMFDTMIAHYLLQPDMRHGMDILAETYLNYSPIKIETLIGKKGAEQGNMRTVALDAITEYAAEDADITLQLKNIFYPMLVESNAMELFTTVEMPLVSVLAQVEMNGITLDSAALHTISATLTDEIKIIAQEIYTLAETSTFNIASPKQLGEILFDKLKIDPKAKKTKTGQYATGEEILSKLEHKHPIIAKILDYRELVKLQNTYVDALPIMVNSTTKKIHTSFNQAVAATGRLSSNNPNLQNIPVRTPRGQEIRKAFTASSPENVILSADYSQIELRIIAALANEQNMIEAFASGVDIHTATAAKVWGVTIEEVTKEMRSKAKTVNFGIIYGISAFGLSERINIPRTEAKEIIESYFNKYPAIQDYMTNTIQGARANGYVETILGRRRYLKDINASNAVVRGYAERNAINAPIQGSSADIIKLAMIKIQQQLLALNLRTKLVLQVHDELVFDCYTPELEQVKALVKNCMSNAVTLSVPLDVETGTGVNWLEAH
ncbi:MAG: DNA polymerase I [Bacteroidia bacterium]|nr:DNA polymerase I [Bacteroidia bacterium]